MTLSPAARLTELLAASRAAGHDFDTAWPAAVGQALANIAPTESSDWQAALAATRAAWQAAWEQRPASRPLLALVAVADDPERVELETSDGDGRQYCPHCDEPLIDPHVLAVYCSKRCREAAYQARLPRAA